MVLVLFLFGHVAVALEDAAYGTKVYLLNHFLIISKGRRIVCAHVLINKPVSVYKQSYIKKSKIKE